MDQFDRAQELDARFIRQALDVQQKVAAFDQEGREECIDCGGRIPKARQKILPGCIRCIDCAEKLETGRRS